MKRTIQNRSGFSLLELMIATMISGIVLAAVMEVFGSNYKSYILQDDVANMQENIRIGMTFLDRDVTMIGSGMPGVDKPGGFNIVKLISGTFKSERAYPLTFQNNAGDLSGGVNSTTGLYNQGTGNSDRLIVRYNDLSQGCGEESADFTDSKGKVISDVLACDRLPQLSLFDKLSKDTDNDSNSAVTKVEEVLAAKNNGCPSTNPSSSCYSLYPQWNESCYCGTTLYDAPTPYFYAIVTSPSGDSSDILVVTQVVGGSTTSGKDGIQNRPYQGFGNKVLGTYDPGSSLSFFNMRTFKEVMYYVQDRELRRRITTYPNPGETQTPPQDQPLAENIDDLQFAFGLDTDGDGNINQWVNDRNLTDDESTQVRLVRINLLGRTARANNTFYTSMQHTIQAATGSASDKLEDHAVSAIEAESPTKQENRFFLRKLLQTTVKVRSLGL